PINLTYNEREELILTERAGKQRVERSYDQNGHLVREATTVDGGKILIQTRHYLQNGFLQNITLHDVETAGGTRDLSFEFVPDPAFRVKEIHHPSPSAGTQVITKYDSYDDLGRHHKVTEGSDYSEDYDYDKNGNLTSVTRGETTDKYEYDGHDRLNFVRKEGESGTEVTERGYYGNGELKFVSVADPQNPTLARTEYEIDAVGRVTREERTSDSGPSPTTYNYSGLVVTI